MATNVEIRDEVKLPYRTWHLCFQKVMYHYDKGQPSEDGYRFMWRYPTGNLQTARGQARIPDKQMLSQLLAAATAQGWY